MDQLVDKQQPPATRREEPVSVSGGRLDVQQVVENYTAGQISIVPIVIRNPFDRPVTILDIIVPNSTFVRAEKQPLRHALEEKEKSNAAWAEIAQKVFRSMEISWFGFRIASPELYRVEPQRQGREVNISAKPGSTVHFDVPDENISAINIDAAENATVKINPVARRAAEGRPATIIPPHCEIVETFAFRAGHSMWSQPTTVNTNIQIDYQFGTARRTQVVPVMATVRPSAAAIIFGAVLGAVTGSLARGVTGFESRSLLAGLTSVFMAIIAAIALSRKSGSQGVLTVEDFYGGFLIGALIGYGGSSVFENAVQPATILRPPAPG